MKKIKVFLITNLWYLPIFCLLPIFFFKLGQSSLVSFDEAWYATIAKNILITGDPINLVFDGGPFLDHPPFGFWLIAGSFKLLGISAFAARFAPALCGFLSLIFIYLIGKNLFSKWVGLFSALALPSAFWFLFRARSGNLDTILVFCFLSTFYFALKLCESKKYLIPFAISLSFLLLTKTLVPFTIIPALLVIFWKSKLSIRSYLLALVIVLVIAGGYFAFNFIKYPNYIGKVFSIGLTGVKLKTNFIDNLTLFKNYLHVGIGKWFWPGVISVFASLIFKQKRFLILSVFMFSFSIMFLFSPKTQIWHLIPLYPFLILSFVGFAFVLAKKFLKSKSLFILSLLFFSVFISYFSFVQIRRSWYEYINVPRYISDEEILSRESAKFNEPLYIDGDFVPTALFYSGKSVVSQTHDETLKDVFTNKQPAVIITKEWRLDSLDITKLQYKLIKTDRDMILVEKND